jgi:Fe-S oxidoreductase
LAGYYDRHGTPMSARALGHVHTLARWGSRFAPLSNAIVRSAPVRWLNEQAVGLDRRRLPPEWAPKAFADQFRSLVRSKRPREGAPHVLLFNDTFTNYYNPAVGMAGARVLDTLGFDVSLAGNACCGRPLVSQGLLDEATRAAFINVGRLHADADSGTPIAFFEPSCLSAVVEDAPALLKGDAKRRAQTIASRAVLFEELVEQHCQSGAALPLSQGPSRVVLHGHCHQKAMGRVAPARALLARLPGTQVTDLDSGCCGMAGSFGYHRAHYDVSRTIAERRIVPAARELEPGAVIVASGVSCRHQVADFAGVRAWHPAELLESLLLADRR